MACSLVRTVTSDRAARSHIMIRFCQDSRQGRLSGGPRRLPIGSRPFWRGCGRGSGAWGCGSVAVTERPERTAQGYRRFRCRECGRQFNERSAGLLNRTQYPSDVIALVVLWRLRYKLSLRDLADMFLIRGIVFSHEAVRDWEAKLAPAMAEELRRLATSAAAGYVDERYIKVHGDWRYLCGAIDRDGALVDAMLSEPRDLAAAKAFFRSARTVTGVVPGRVTTDGHDADPAAIRSELGEAVRHRMNIYLNNRLEQASRDQGSISIYAGFKSVTSAGRFCRAFDELRIFCVSDPSIANMSPRTRSRRTQAAK